MTADFLTKFGATWVAMVPFDDISIEFSILIVDTNLSEENLITLKNSHST